MNWNPSPFALRALLVVALCALPFAAHAQSATATLSGTIVDENGALVPGCAVTILNDATSLKREVTTNDDGRFTVPLLPPGSYRLTASHDGFKTVEVRDLILNVNDERSLRIQMKLGDVKEVVNVTSEASLISESPAVGTVVDRQFVENIPLNGRSFQALITLTPGVLAVPTNSTALNTGQFSVNGQRSDANMFMVDGVSGNFGTATSVGPGAQTSGNLPGLTVAGTTQSLASVDAMQEFKVQTSTYAAEHGRQPGGQISILTRSGTNDYHGSVFDYLRNDKFDANDWFANANRQPRPPERQNDFGGTLGGPVRLPGYNGLNRTFFFFSYEGLQLRQPKFALMNVPTLTLRQTAPAALQPILNAFPLPNGRNLGNGLAELTTSYSDRSSLNATSLRIDHAINEKLGLFGRMNLVPSSSVVRGANTSLSRVNTTSIYTKTFTIGLTSIITSQLSNELRINLTDNPGSGSFTLDSFGGAIPPLADALIPSQHDSLGSLGAVNLSFTGRTQPTGLPNVGRFSGLQQFNQRQINVVDGASWRVDSHQLKFGFDYRRLTPLSGFNPYGVTVIFTTQQQILSGVASNAAIITQAEIRPRYTNFSAYAQDTWKLSNRMTIDLGVRWDVNPSPGGPAGKLPLAVTGIANLATMQLAPQGTKLWKTTYHNFGPRIGLAYLFRNNPGRETVLRGGFGVFYDTGNNQGSASLVGLPFLVQRTVTAVTYPLSATQLAPTPLPNPSSLTPPFSFMAIFDSHLKLPYTLHWNVTVEQSLGKSQALSLSYVSAVGRRLLQQRTVSLSAINPRFTLATLTTNRATSDYHALQTQFRRRLSEGLQALISYTWSHALDEDSADNGSIIPVRGNSTFDVRHNFAAAATYDIPSPSQNRILKHVLGMWSLDTSIRARSAFPVDIRGTTFFSPADGSQVAARANVILGVPLYINDPTLPGGKRINRAAFSTPAVGQFGNLGRNVVRGLGAWQVDTALRRQFKLTEKLSLQFRAEAFNLFNHPNFGAFQTSLTAANFGQATNMLNNQLGGLSPIYQIGGPRSFQFALKLQF